MGGLGPAIGRVDVRESKDSYLFGVALPPLEGDDSKFFFHEKMIVNVVSRSPPGVADLLLKEHISDSNAGGGEILLRHWRSKFIAPSWKKTKMKRRRR
ncbi:hypothetical protein Q3G72_011058 [Acer saccharum]|nr:hypothetical protein Q3G72_011058 [Acer saccharum]